MAVKQNEVGLPDYLVKQVIDSAPMGLIVINSDGVIMEN